MPGLSERSGRRHQERPFGRFPEFGLANDVRRGPVETVIRCRD